MRYILAAFLVWLVMVFLLFFTGVSEAQPDPIGVPWDPSDDAGPLIRGPIDIDLGVPWQGSDDMIGLTIGDILIHLGVPWDYSEDFILKAKDWTGN